MRLRQPEGTTRTEAPDATEAPARPRTPSLGGRGWGTSQSAPVRLARRYPQLATWRPGRWIAHDGAVVARIKLTHLIGGHRGVAYVRGRANVDGLLANAAIAGYRVLPWDVEGPGTSYIVAVPDSEGGWVDDRSGEPQVWRCAWEYHDGREWRSDSAVYYAWVRRLMASGVIPAPDPRDLARLRDELVAGRDTQLSTASKVGREVADERARPFAAQLQAIDAAIKGDA